MIVQLTITLEKTNVVVDALRRKGRVNVMSLPKEL